MDRSQSSSRQEPASDLGSFKAIEIGIIPKRVMEVCLIYVAMWGRRNDTTVAPLLSGPLTCR